MLPSSLLREIIKFVRRSPPTQGVSPNVGHEYDPHPLWEEEYMTPLDRPYNFSINRKIKSSP